MNDLPLQDHGIPNHAEAQRLRNRILGATLRQQRLETGSSLDDIGEALGVETDLVEAWEYGEAAPTDQQMAALARQFDMLRAAFDSSRPSAEPAIANADSREMRELRMRVRGGLLRAARQREGLSIGQLSRAAGLDKDDLTAFELGERSISPQRMAKLAAALNRDASEFMPDAAEASAAGESAAESDRETRAIGDLTQALRQLPKPHLKGIAEALLAVAEARSNANGA